MAEDMDSFMHLSIALKMFCFSKDHYYKRILSVENTGHPHTCTGSACVWAGAQQSSPGESDRTSFNQERNQIDWTRCKCICTSKLYDKMLDFSPFIPYTSNSMLGDFV